MKKQLHNLLEKINEGTARSGVIGMGYVGLPLMMELAKGGFDVTGFEVDESKADKVNNGVSYIMDVPTDRLAVLVESGRFRGTTDFSLLKEMDTINICVPTPLRKTKDPDISYIVSAVKEIQQNLRPGQLIILESTTYPGTTDEVILGSLENTGLKVGEDFFLAFSPERVDPGNDEFTTRNIPKVVGGTTPNCTKAAVALYEKSIETVVPVASTKVAEMVKLLENTFRSVNIGLVNELTMMCDKLRINVWEVIEAAATKPFGFMPFYPGPGLGGHCIPIDPFYLSWKAKLAGFEARFIELAGQVNSYMPIYVVTRIQDALNDFSKSLRYSKVLTLGVAYKGDIDDVRESPALDIMRMLLDRGAIVSYSDEHIPSFNEFGLPMESMELTEELLEAQDLVLITTRHSYFDLEMIVRHSRLIMDTRNALKNFKDDHIYRI